MTSGTNGQRHDTTEAREKLKGLLASHGPMPEARLLESSGLTVRLFERSVMDLLDEGQVQRHAHGEGRSTYVLHAPLERERGAQLNSLAQDVQTVHAYLQAKPNTARVIAASLALPDHDVHRILNELEHLGLVSIRYVGKLNIYRAC